MWRNGKCFPCPDCHKTFATQVDLKAHLMRHITQHPYVCFACGKGFKYDHTLDFHIKSQHGADSSSSSSGSGGGSGNSMVTSGSNGNFNAGSGGKNDSLNLKSLSRKGCKMKRELLFDEKVAGAYNRGKTTPTTTTSITGQGGISSSSSNYQKKNEDSSEYNNTNNNGNNCDNNGIDDNSSNNPVIGSGPSNGIGSASNSDTSILSGLKFPIVIGSYSSSSSSPSAVSALVSTSSSSLTTSIVSTSTISASLASSTLPPIPLKTSPSSSSLTTAISSSLLPALSQEKSATTNGSSSLLQEFGIQGDLSPRSLQIKSEKVLISVLEGVHTVNEQTYSLYKCCLCGFAFPSLEPVSIHVQSMHSNNLNLICDKCGATFKWKSELQLHEQLHKSMDKSTKCKLQQHHHHQQQQQPQPQHQQKSLIMSSFLQPNLVLMNPYLSGTCGDQISTIIGNTNGISSSSNDGGSRNGSVDRRGGDDESIEEDDSDGQGLNLCLKPKQESKFDFNDGRLSMVDKNNNNNNNNIDNMNNSNNNNNSAMILSSDEPIDLKIEPYSDPNNNVNGLINPLSFLHQSLLPSSLPLSFPPTNPHLTTTAAAAAAFAAGISQHCKVSLGGGIGGVGHNQPNAGGHHYNENRLGGSVSGNGNGKITEPIGDIEETAPGQFKCRFCDKTFDRIFSVHRHERVHTGYKPCICKVCGRGFSEKRNLRHHIIRFHSDGSGRELLKRVRKEKSMSAASFLKKAAVRLLSNSSLEGSAMEEDGDVSVDDNGNGNRNGNDHDNDNDNDNDNDSCRRDSTIVNKNQSSMEPRRKTSLLKQEEGYEDQSDRRSRESEDNNNDGNNNNNNKDSYCSRAFEFNQEYKNSLNHSSNNNNCNDDGDREGNSDVNGESVEEDDKNGIALSYSVCSSSRRRKSKPSKKISSMDSSSVKSDDEESELPRNLQIKREVNDGDENNYEEDELIANNLIKKERDPELEEERYQERECETGKEKEVINKKERELDCKMENDLNGLINGSQSLHESKLRSHGAFFSNYSPRLTLVDKALKRAEACRPMIGPDGRFLYPCGYCQKTFCSLSDLNRHIGFHENVRPFKCEFCDYQSRTNSQLKVHMMRHAGIKQFLCNICNYNGVTQSDLNRHCKTRSHVLRSANVCSICSLGFATSTLLEDHIFKFHEHSSSSPAAASVLTGTSSPKEKNEVSSSSGRDVPLLLSKSNEVDNNNSIDVNYNQLGSNANRFTVNNLL